MMRQPSLRCSVLWCTYIATIGVILLALSSPLVANAYSAIPSIIVGGGRIGSLLADLGIEADAVIRRGERLPNDPSSGPIYVCTRNDDLASVIEATPVSRRGDLCFLQNGMLGEFIKEQGLPDDTTQCLLFLAVPTIGAPPVDGVTDLNPEGLTCTTGKWANELAARLASAGLKCNIKTREEFLAAALEKHIFICVTNVVGQLHGGLTVGEVYEETYDELRRDLVQELIAAGSRKVGVTLPPGTFDRLVAYGRSVPDFPTGIKEFEWRNGWFYDITRHALDAGSDDPLPLHTQALQKLGVIE